MRIPNQIYGNENKFTKFNFERRENGKIFLYTPQQTIYYEITVDNLIDLVLANTVNKSLFKQELIAIELDNKEIYFVSKNNKVYRDYIKNNGFKIKDITVGEIIVLQDGQKGIFVGSFYRGETYYSDEMYYARNHMMKIDNVYQHFMPSDIFYIDGVSELNVDKNNNLKKLNESYINTRKKFFNTKQDLRDYVKANNLHIYE